MILLHIGILLLLSSTCHAQIPERKFFAIKSENSSFDLSFYFFPEFFYGKNLTFLNDDNHDEMIQFRHFIDSFATYTYGPESDYFFKAKFSVRSRSIWGNNISVLMTTDQPIKEVDVVFGSHNHGLVLNDVWMRELWFDVALNDMLHIPFCNRHVLTVGAFFFEIGRGISLGAFYPSLPAPIGFFIDAQIDQYAFGMRLSGDMVKDALGYDIYGAIWNNKSATFDQTNQKIRLSQFGHRHDGARGFGSINYVVASRLKWYPLPSSDYKKVYFEPYVIYNHNPEIRLDLIADGVSDLVTIGCMGEFTFGDIECGFETACNRGHLRAFGIDKNSIELTHNNGVLKVVNSKVSDNILESEALVIPENQHAIITSPVGERFNVKPINVRLKNKKFRFRDPFDIKYKGSFFVADASYIICKDIFKISAGFGFATGDHDPRKALLLTDCDNRCVDYNGFITLNESYAGKRVTSMLFFNGFGAFPRVIDVGLEGVVQDITVNNVTGFTNLIYAGVSCDYHYKNEYRTWRLCPNLLFYWQDEPIRRFTTHPHPHDENKFIHTHTLVNPFLGTEINLLAEYEALKDLTFFTLAGVFFPGNHFAEMKGRPLNAAQAEFVADPTGPREPLLGNDNAYFVNFGFKYTF